MNDIKITEKRRVCFLLIVLLKFTFVRNNGIQLLSKTSFKDQPVCILEMATGLGIGAMSEFTKRSIGITEKNGELIFNIIPGNLVITTDNCY